MGTLNGVKIGLDSVYYSLLIADASSGVTYSTPVSITGAIQANINPNSSIATLFADDGPLETAAQLGNIELELNMADIPLSVQATLLGKTAPTVGIMLDKSTDSPPWLALGFRSLKSNGKYRYVWLVKGKFREPEDNHQTKDDSIDFQTPTITGNFVKREYDNVWRKRADADEAGYVATTGTNWFTTGPTAP